MKNQLELALMLAAVGQFCIAVLNLNLIRIMRWQADLARMSLLVREVFQIHAWFISITLCIFAAFTARFASEMAAQNQATCRWIACSIGLFWAIRAILQITWYSGSHWRGIASRTVVHIILLVVYGGFAAVYFIAGFA